MPKECVLISTARRRNTPPARRSARGPRARPSASSGSRPLPPLSAYHNTTRNPFRRCARCGSSRCATSHTVGAYGAHVPLSEQARAPLQLQPATGRGLGPQRRGSLHGHPRAIRVILWERQAAIKPSAVRNTLSSAIPRAKSDRNRLEAFFEWTAEEGANVKVPVGLSGASAKRDRSLAA